MCIHFNFKNKQILNIIILALLCGILIKLINPKIQNHILGLYVLGIFFVLLIGMYLYNKYKSNNIKKENMHNVNIYSDFHPHNNQNEFTCDKNKIYPNETVKFPKPYAASLHNQDYILSHGLEFNNDVPHVYPLLHDDNSDLNRMPSINSVKDILNSKKQHIFYNKSMEFDKSEYPLLTKDEWNVPSEDNLFDVPDIRCIGDEKKYGCFKKTRSEFGGGDIKLEDIPKISKLNKIDSLMVQQWPLF